MSFILPNQDTFLAPHKTAPNPASPSQTDDNWRELEIYLNQKKAPPPSGAPNAIVGFLAEPSSLFGVTQWFGGGGSPLLLNQPNLRLPLWNNTTEDSVYLTYGTGWVYPSINSGNVLKMPVIDTTGITIGGSGAVVLSFYFGALTLDASNYLSYDGAISPLASNTSYTFQTTDCTYLGSNGSDLSLTSSGIETASGSIGYFVGISLTFWVLPGTVFT